jgi:pimeloyl-ACP methyl ester carboxylesterase
MKTQRGRVTEPLVRFLTTRYLALPSLGVLAGLVACETGDGAASNDTDAGLELDAEIMEMAPASDAGEAQAIESLRSAYRAAASTFSLPVVDWRPCPLVTTSDGAGAECAEIAVPLSWRAPDTSTTHVFVKHVPSLEPPKKRIWLLWGGPGLAGGTLDVVAVVQRSLLPSAEFFLMDYRGTGRSGRLGCPGQEDATGAIELTGLSSEAQAQVVERCFEMVEAALPPSGLQAFNTTETAMDLGVLAAALGDRNSDILVYGVSFGTFVAHRYLHLFPEQPAAVILDSFVLPTGRRNPGLDFDRAARDILGACTLAPDCSARLGDDPIEFAVQVMERLAQGHCSELAAAGVDAPSRFGDMAAQAVLDVTRRNFLPALYFRADRCAPADVEALVTFERPASAPVAAIPISTPLSLMVNRSEMFDESLFLPITSTLIAAGGASQAWRPYWDAIPSYDRDAFWGAWAHTDAPILVLQAQIDGQTPPANGQAARDNLGSPALHHAFFPWLNHGVIGDAACGAVVIAGFLADPLAAPDTSCAAHFPAPDFVVAKEEAMARFGEADLWENGAPLESR